MPSYYYTAKSFNGKTVSGVHNARDASQLAQVLKSEGFILIKADLKNPEIESSPFKKDLLAGFFRVSSAEKIMMVKNLWVMLAAGLSMVKSFDILAMQAKKAKLKSALLDIKEKIYKGQNLSDSLAEYPMIFSELFCNMIKVGEESGTLATVFQMLALQLTKEHELRAKIKNAMIYPCLIIVTMIGIGVLIVTVVLPKLSVFFFSLNAPIPFYTRFMLNAGLFLSERWYWLIIVPVIGGVALWIGLKTKRGKILLDTIILRTPIISQLAKQSNSALLIRALSSLIAAGVPLVRALEISAKTVGNHYFKKAITESVDRVKRGEKLSTALKSYQEIFPLGTIEMIEVGEETGKTSSILKKLADFYEQEAINTTESLSVVIEPVLIIFLGAAVGFFAFSIIMPMYSVLGSIE